MQLKTSKDLLAQIEDTLDRLRAGTISPDEAHAETRLFDQVTRVLALNLEHARLTNRLTSGSRHLPTFDLFEGQEDDSQQPKNPPQVTASNRTQALGKGRP